MMHCRWNPRNKAAILFCLTGLANATCLSPQQAANRIGATTCVSAKVTQISQGPDGVQYIDFCADHSTCAFSGVVFAKDLRDVGDIRTLPGKTVEVHGQIQEYEGRSEIIVHNARQLRGAGVSLPAVPKQYDVEQRGHFSAGSSRPPKKAKTPKKKRKPLSGTVEVPADDSQ
jgi:hypothetical protein